MAILKRQVKDQVDIYTWTQRGRTRVHKTEVIGPDSIVYIGDPAVDITKFIDNDDAEFRFHEFVPVLWEPWDPGKDYDKWGWMKVTDFRNSVV